MFVAAVWRRRLAPRDGGSSIAARFKARSTIWEIVADEENGRNGAIDVINRRSPSTVGRDISEAHLKDITRSKSQTRQKKQNGPVADAKLAAQVAASDHLLDLRRGK